MNEFDEATQFNEATREQLNEKQRFYADELIKLGYEVRFNDVRILHRKGQDGIVITILRKNLKWGSDG